MIEAVLYNRLKGRLLELLNWRVLGMEEGKERIEKEYISLKKQLIPFVK